MCALHTHHLPFTEGGTPPNWAAPSPGRQGAPHHHHPLDPSENHSQAGSGSNWGWWSRPVRVVIEGWKSLLPFQGPAVNVPALSLLLIHLTSWSRTLAVSSRGSWGQLLGEGPAVQLVPDSAPREGVSGTRVMNPRGCGVLSPEDSGDA